MNEQGHQFDERPSPPTPLPTGEGGRRPGEGTRTKSARKTSNKSAKAASRGKPAEATAASPISFRATLLRPKASAQASGKSSGKAVSWSFLTLPQAASAKLPSRSMVSVHGTFHGVAFQATLEPDGQGGHWLKVDRALREAAGAEAGDVVTLEIAPVAEEPEPRVPADLRKALAAAPQGVRKVWSDITLLARRDWIHWIVSAKQAETRTRRIRTACDMLAKGKRRPCCFDRSGMYAKSLSCPEADDTSN
jgi:Bacteriocin-protection, YdeI or OmpD-Associated/Domain of unknown function (DUF1905)